MTKAAFDIPENPNQSTNGARKAYFAQWKRDWPLDDNYLRTLARDVPPSEPGFSRCEFLLTTMRENHVFEPDKE